MGRLQFAVATENRSFAADRQRGAIGGALTMQIAFRYSDDDIDAGQPRGAAERVSFGSADLDRVFEIGGARFPGKIMNAALDPERVARQP